MTHANDDELLEQALRRAEPDAEALPHLKECPSCAARYDEVLAEQELLRRALAPAEAPARVERSVLAPRRSGRWAAAAALFLAALAGALISRATAPPRPSAAPLSLARVEHEIRRIPEEVESLRAAEPSRLEREYPRVLSKAEALYADFLSIYLDGASPLSDAQRSEIRQAVDTLYAHVWIEEDVDKLAGEFRGALQTALNAHQFEAFQAQVLREKDSVWAEEIDIVTDDLAEALNLRFSEEERVREVLKGRYPKSDLPMLTLAQWPPDRLAGDAGLASIVRGSLEAGYHAAYDAYLQALRDGHRRVEKVARAMTPGLGR